MDLIKGNLLILISVFGVTAFCILWQKLDQGIFRRNFIYSRKDNMRYEYKLLVKLLSLVSVATLAVYYVLSYFLDVDYKSIWQVTFVVLYVLLIYFMVANKGSIAQNAFLACMMLFVVIIIPSATTLAILVFQINLDTYCGLLSIILVVLDAILTHNSVRYWKRGDL